MATVLNNTASNQFIVSNTYLKQVIKDLFYWYRIALIFLGFITQRLQQNSFMISIKCIPWIVLDCLSCYWAQLPSVPEHTDDR